MAFCVASTLARQEKPANQIAAKPLGIHVTEDPKWQNDCLKVTYDVVNRSGNTLWLPINGSRVNAAVRVTASKHGALAKDDWVAITPFFDSGPWDAVPMLPGETDHEEPCFSRTFHVSKKRGGGGRNLPVRAQIQIVIEYFLNEQDWHTNVSQHRVMMTKQGAEWEHLLADLLQPQVAAVVLAVPCFPGERASECNKRPRLKEGEAVRVP